MNASLILVVEMKSLGELGYEAIFSNTGRTPGERRRVLWV